MHDELTDATIQQAAIAEWRDTATMAAIALVHDAAVHAMMELEAQLETSAIANTAFNASTLARETVTVAVHAQIDRELPAWLKRQREALQSIDPRLASLTHELAEPPELSAHHLEAAAAPQTEVASRFSTPEWVSSSLGTVGSAISQAAMIVADRAIPDTVRDGTTRLIDQASREIGERSGIRDWVRDAGRKELAGTWLGTVSDDEVPAYLIRQFARIDRTTIAAKALLA